MSAEDMRIELETFVNQGLQEGWRGWPMKGQFADQHDSDGVRHTAAAGIGCRVLPVNWWFPRLVPVRPSQTHPGYGELADHGFVVARESRGDESFLSYFG